jgi:putative ABC transport system permease protein
MFYNYLKIALRNILKNKFYSVINVLGLAIGLAVCVLLLLYVQEELSYDRFHPKGERIYRLCNPTHPFHAPQTAKLLAENFPEIEDYARILIRGNCIVEYGEKKFKEGLFTYADPGLFRLFSFTFVEGNTQTALSEPYSLVISKTIADKYFGNKEALGKTLRLDNEAIYTVTGVIEDMPHNSHFRYDLIATLTNAEDLFGTRMMNHWGWMNFATYFLFHPDFSESEFTTKCNAFIAEQLSLSERKPPILSLQMLKDIHLYSTHIENDLQPQGDISYVLIFSGIGILILLIACFNYINLFTTYATKRAKEIGIKKTAGATRKQLASQFILESFTILGIAFLLSLGIVEFFLPAFNTLTGKYLSFSSLIQTKTVLSILTILFVTGILASSYPAYILSSFKPASVLKTGGNNVNIAFNFRKVLVGTQLTIVIVLIISAVFMFQQLNYLLNKKLGYEKELVLVSEINDFKDIESYNSLKNVLEQQNDVINVSAASRVPSDDLNNWASFLPDGQTDKVNMPIVHVSYNYFEALGITASQGRFFSEQMKTDEEKALILNEAAAKRLTLPEESIGADVHISWPNSKRQVIGIVKDFHFESLYNTISPAAFVVSFPEFWKILVKVKSNNTKDTIEKLQAISREFYPDELFEFHFLDQKLEAIYKAEQRTFKLLGYFTLLAIFIACLGLLGMSSFIIKRRFKEIGIRKVLGASLSQIIITLIRDFIKWVVIANFIAWPLAWYAMKLWLQNFAYRIDIDLWVFILSGSIALVLVLATVSSLAIKAATSNPADSLRTE